MTETKKTDYQFQGLPMPAPVFDEEIQAPEEKPKEELPSTEPELTPFDLFMMKHTARCSMWIKDHKDHHKFPIISDGKGNYHWMNRAERRRK